MSASLVGSEMCIRDRWRACLQRPRAGCGGSRAATALAPQLLLQSQCIACLLYTSDAADDM
eukprot:2473127-Alexandrium_andersonii.AAC.1